MKVPTMVKEVTIVNVVMITTGFEMVHSNLIHIRWPGMEVGG